VSNPEARGAFKTASGSTGNWTPEDEREKNPKKKFYNFCEEKKGDGAGSVNQQTEIRSNKHGRGKKEGEFWFVWRIGMTNKEIRGEVIRGERRAEEEGEWGPAGEGESGRGKK